MDEKRLNKKLEDVLAFAWDNPHSFFYRSKYANAGLTKEYILDPKNFEKIPFLTKNELEDTPPFERLFVEPHKVHFTGHTSGTTSQKSVIMLFSAINRYYFDPTLGMPITRILITHPPLNKNFGHSFIQQCKQVLSQPIPIFGDYQNLLNSAIIASKTEADALYATPTIACMLAPFLKDHYNIERFKLLVLTSETLTSTRRIELSRLYPRARIANVYGSAEIGQLVLYPCVRMLEEGRDAFHVLHEAVDRVELIENELVITYSLNKALPLIRYKTRDYFKEEAGCLCGTPGPVLSWMGRLNVDRIRVAGVEITVDGVERVFADFRHLIGDQYQVHFYSHSEGGKETIRIVVEVLDSYPFGDRNLGAIANEVARALPDAWRISPSATLRDAMEKGLFMTPEIKFIKEFSEKKSKVKRLINHI